MVQELKPTDFPKRVEFCQFIQEKLHEDNNFLDKILFSDGARFSKNGAVNRHNCHYYSQVNPRWIRGTHFQNIIISVNVWCGIINDHIIGPYFFDGNLNGEMYLQFLETQLGPLLEEIDLDMRRVMWFQHDGAPPHFHHIVRQHLNENFASRWVGRGINTIGLLFMGNS